MPRTIQYNEKLAAFPVELLTFNAVDFCEQRYSYSSLVVNKTFSINDPIQDLLISRLSSVHGVDAVFIRIDDDDVYHVYTVVREHSSNLYGRVMAQENVVRSQYPGEQFDFRIRAHQGRKPSEAVPVSAQPTFLR